jgi:NADH:ubiquinone oxidoreductase subunit 6 (subunit J)
MTAEQIIFITLSVIVLGTALLVVTLRNLFHAALALMATFLGVAGLYVMLDAGFLAAAQLLVYIGAISILLIFAIMMTRRIMTTTEPPFNSQVGAALITAVTVFLVVVWVFIQSGLLDVTKPVGPEVSVYLDNSVAQQWGRRLWTRTVLCCRLKLPRYCCWRRWLAPLLWPGPRRRMKTNGSAFLVFNRCGAFVCHWSIWFDVSP